MAQGREHRDLIGPLLVVNLVVYLIVIGLAAWSIHKYIHGQQNHPHLGGNPATIFVLTFGMGSAVVGVCAVFSGIMHRRAWRSVSLAAASSPATISWAVTALAFGFVCKEIILGGHIGTRLKTLELFILISLLSQLLYLVLLHDGMYSSRYGPSYRDIDSGINYGGGVSTSDERQKTETPGAIETPAAVE